MGAKPYKRKMRNMIVDKRFQIKYTVLIILLSLAIFGNLGWLYYSELKASTELVNINTSMKKALVGEIPVGDLELPDLGSGAGDDYLANSLDELDADLSPELTTRDTRNVYLLLGAVALMVLALALAGIYVTHKMAGPLYALKLFMRAAQEGQWRRIRPFRQGDEFAHVGDEFLKLVAAIKEKHQTELAALEELAAQQQLPAEAKERLEAVIKAKQDYLSH